MSDTEDRENDYPESLDDDYKETPDDYQEKTFNELEDIHNTLREIQDAIPRVNSQSVIWFVVVLFLVWGLLGPALGRFNRWTHKVWYSMRYGADLKNITILKKPSDCDFLHAPLGEKGCSFKKHVEPFGEKERQTLIQQATTSEEQQEIAKRPNLVFVYWEKKED